MEANQIGIVEMVISILTLVVSTAITFYIKDWYQKRVEYNSLKQKITKIAGKGAKVIFSGPDGTDLYTIESIDYDGIILKSKVHTIFLPIKQLIENEIILPAEDYKKRKAEKLIKDLEEASDIIMPVFIRKTFPQMIEGIKKYVTEELEPGGEFDAIVGLKITKALKDHGLEIKEIESKEEEE